MTSRPKIAMVSVGLGRVQRGFERLFADLFELVKDDVDVTLYKSGGAVNARERVPRFLKSLTALTRKLPAGKLMGETEYNRDCVAFGLALAPYLLRERYDVIHCIDPPMAKVIVRLKRFLRLDARLLFTEASAMPPAYYPRVDHVHHIAPWAVKQAVAAGVPEATMTLVPSGTYPQGFDISASREELRRKYDVSPDAFVVVSVSAVNRTQKRVDYLVEEVSRVDGDILLWIDGNPEDPTLVELAERKLGTRCRITHLPSFSVPELYRLADVMALASTTESFGIAVIEALSTGLFVLTHDSSHFDWLVADRDCLVDMTSEGSLADRLRTLMTRRDELRSEERAARTRSRFDWNALSRDYLDLYDKVASVSAERAPR